MSSKTSIVILIIDHKYENAVTEIIGGRGSAVILSKKLAMCVKRVIKKTASHLLSGL